MEKYMINQNYNSYTNEDHETWAILCSRLGKLDKNKISKRYLQGFDNLQINTTKVIRIDEISTRLEAISGWTLVPVAGLLPTKEFFYMLINKKYPVTVPIRK